MPGIISLSELDGSPSEIQTWAPMQAFWWDPTPELAIGETPSSPTCTVQEYDPRYLYDLQDVSNAALQAVSVDSGSHANQIKIVTKAASGWAKPGYMYRFQLTCIGSLASSPARYFVLACKV